MNDLETLNALFDMTREAEEWASAVEKSERLRSLVDEIRWKAKDEYNRLRRDRRKMETRYQLCMIGILEELDFGKVLCAKHDGVGGTRAASVKTSTEP
jgi:hypothetical protein